ncbi:MAG: hypothetical protein ACRC2T_16265 [Thermoguttaceae bacterium]
MGGTKKTSNILGRQCAAYRFFPVVIAPLKCETSRIDRNQKNTQDYPGSCKFLSILTGAFIMRKLCGTFFSIEGKVIFIAVFFCHFNFVLAESTVEQDEKRQTIELIKAKQENNRSSIMRWSGEAVVSNANYSSSNRINEQLSYHVTYRQDMTKDRSIAILDNFSSKIANAPPHHYDKRSFLYLDSMFYELSIFGKGKFAVDNKDTTKRTELHPFGNLNSCSVDRFNEHNMFFRPFFESRLKEREDDADIIAIIYDNLDRIDLSQIMIEKSSDNDSVTIYLGHDKLSPKTYSLSHGGIKVSEINSLTSSQYGRNEWTCDVQNVNGIWVPKTTKTVVYDMSGGKTEQIIDWKTIVINGVFSDNEFSFAKMGAFRGLPFNDGLTGELIILNDDSLPPSPYDDLNDKRQYYWLRYFIILIGAVMILIALAMKYRQWKSRKPEATP